MNPLQEGELRRTFDGRRVLVTGHTGFKGGWLCLWLKHLGAHVTGYALAPSTTPCLYELAGVSDAVNSIEGDIRDLPAFEAAWKIAAPDIVFHLAAQALVRESYQRPLDTLDTNIMGTANILDIARRAGRRIAVVLVTSDKCYENRETLHWYTEDDPLGGHDIYSASKAAAELVISSYRRSFFKSDTAAGVAAASARAGNVIGGGDWSADRLVPDAIRALVCGLPIEVRNPRSIRPWQHVLEPLLGYLMLGSRLLSDDESIRNEAAGAWNFGPAGDNARTVSDLVDLLVRSWGRGEWRAASVSTTLHEAGMLHLSAEKAQKLLGWRPRWDFEETIRHTVDWYKAWNDGREMNQFCIRQIEEHSGGTSDNGIAEAG